MKKCASALITVALISISLLQMAPVTASSNTQYRLPVPSDTLVIPAGAHNIHTMNRGTVSILMSLNLRHQASLSSLIRSQSTPGSTQYHKWLSPARFDSLFSPSSGEVSTVTAYLESFGMNVTHVSQNRLLIAASATPAELHAAFDVTPYSFNIDGHEYYAAGGMVTLPAGIASLISGVQGLQDYVQAAHPMLGAVHSQSSLYSPPTGLNPTPPYNPATIHAAYNFTQAYRNGYSGSGVSVSIITAYAFDNASIQTFDSTFGIVANRINVVQPYGGTTQLNLETTLDTEWMSATAPNSTINVVEGINPQLGTFTQLFNYVVSKNLSSVVTTSWGTPESVTPSSTITQDNGIFKQAAAQGITIFAASGDFGAYDNTSSPTPDFPASSPYVTGVGGTWLNLSKTGSGITISSETGWNKSGGGISSVFGKPYWQVGPGTPSTGGRAVPDVSLNAKPSSGYFVFYNSSWLEAGGTSFGSPIWGGIMSLENQFRAMKGEPSMGFANPSFYRILNSSNYSVAFHDITQGYNGYYSAHQGYDMVTGVGTPSVYDLLLILAKQPTKPLKAIATGSPPAGDVPLYVSLYAEISGGLGPYNVSWALNGSTAGSFGAPFSYQLQNILKIYNAGNYTIRLTVRDNVSEVSVSYFNVTAYSNPSNTLKASLSGSPTSGDANLTVSFSTSVSGLQTLSTEYYRYAFADGGYLTTSSPTVKHTYVYGGNFTALVTAYENVTGSTPDNYTAQSLFSVTVFPHLVAEILSNRTGGSYPLHILFTASNNGGKAPFAYSWTYTNQSGSFSLSGKYLYVNYSSVGNYTVTLSVTDFYSSHSVASETIRVYNPLSGLINVSPSANGVAPYNVTFVATVTGGAGGYSYLWNFGGGNTAFGNPANFVFSSGGNFTVRLTVHDLAGDVLHVTTHVVVQGLGLLQLFQNRITLLIITAMIVIAAVVSYAILRKKGET